MVESKKTPSKQIQVTKSTCFAAHVSSNPTHFDPASGMVPPSFKFPRVFFVHSAWNLQLHIAGGDGMGQLIEFGIYEYIHYSIGNPYIGYIQTLWLGYINPTIWVDGHSLCKHWELTDPSTYGNDGDIEV